MTELEILRRRRELVVLSAELQRATLVRRLERVDRHPLHAALGFAKHAASLSLSLKLGLFAAGRIAAQEAFARRGPKSLRSSPRWIWVLRLVPVQSRISRPEVPQPLTKETTMLYWAAVFFIIALIAAVLGFGGIAAGAAGIAKILFFIFLIAFVVSLLMGVFRRSV